MKLCVTSLCQTLNNRDVREKVHESFSLLSKLVKINTPLSSTQDTMKDEPAFNLGFHNIHHSASSAAAAAEGRLARHDLDRDAEHQRDRETHDSCDLHLPQN